MAGEAGTLALFDGARVNQLISDAFHNRSGPLGILIADLRNSTEIANTKAEELNTRLIEVKAATDAANLKAKACRTGTTHGAFCAWCDCTTPRLIS